MPDVSLSDLTEEAADTASEAAGSGQSTGEWMAETVKLLDKRGYLEPLLWGKEGLPDEQKADPTESEGGVDITASMIADAGRGVMAELGEDVTVAELVQICEANPDLVNQQLAELDPDQADPDTGEIEQEPAANE